MFLFKVKKKKKKKCFFRIKFLCCHAAHVVRACGHMHKIISFQIFVLPCCACCLCMSPRADIKLCCHAAHVVCACLLVHKIFCCHANCACCIVPDITQKSCVVSVLPSFCARCVKLLVLSAAQKVVLSLCCVVCTCCACCVVLSYAQICVVMLRMLSVLCCHRHKLVCCQAIYVVCACCVVLPCAQDSVLSCSACRLCMGPPA